MTIELVVHYLEQAKYKTDPSKAPSSHTFPASVSQRESHTKLQGYASAKNQRATAACTTSVPILQRDFILRARLLFLELFFSAGERRATGRK